MSPPAARNLLLSAALMLSPPGLSAQQSGNNPADTAVETNPSRVVKFRIAPTFPEIARKMKLKGAVQLEAIVRPDGSVREVHILGGHPILADAACRAVMQWRFKPDTRETHEIVRIEFGE